MTPINGFNVSNLQATAHDNLVLKVDGYYKTATTQAWLQVHDTNAGPPATGAVPLKEEPIAGASPFYFEFKRGDLCCYLGVFVGISTTEGTWTASADKMDVSVEISDPDLPASVSYAGDLTTAVNGLQVWSEATGLAGRLSLVALEVDGTNLTGGTQFIMIFAKDAGNLGTAPIMAFPITAGLVLTGENKLTFGDAGRQIFSMDANGTTQRLGCQVFISGTAGIYSAPNGNAFIKAEYRTEP